MYNFGDIIYAKVKIISRDGECESIDYAVKPLDSEKNQEKIFVKEQSMEKSMEDGSQRCVHNIGEEVFVKVKIIDRIYKEGTMYGVESLDYPPATGNGRKIYVRESHVKDLYPEMTVEEAWELARRIACDTNCKDYIPEQQMYDIFGCLAYDEVLLNNTPGQVKRKLEEWNEKNKIHKDDVVLDDIGKKCVVSTVIGNKCTVVYPDGRSWTYDYKKLSKTGERIALSELLRKI